MGAFEATTVTLAPMIILSMIIVTVIIEAAPIDKIIIEEIIIEATIIEPVITVPTIVPIIIVFTIQAAWIAEHVLQGMLGSGFESFLLFGSLLELDLILDLDLDFGYLVTICWLVFNGVKIQETTDAEPGKTFIGGFEVVLEDSHCLNNRRRHIEYSEHKL